VTEAAGAPAHARPDDRVLPERTSESDAFWTGGANDQLLIHRCTACSHFFHPPAPACFRCRSTDVAPAVASGFATVAAFSINAHQWLPGFPPPYVVAIVELDDATDVRLTTNVMDCEIHDVHIGMRVEVLFEQWEDVWIPVFRPVAG